MPMKKSKINKLRKKEKIDNPKEWWQTPLWVLKKPSGLLSEDLVQRSKLISNDVFLMLKRERFLIGLKK